MSDQLDPYNVEEFKSVFDLFDVDSKGTIPKNELANAISTLGFNIQNRDDMQDVVSLFKQEGTITYEEYLQVMVRCLSEFDDSQKMSFQEIFNLADKDCNGLISSGELFEVISNKKKGKNYTEEEVKQMFAESDLDEDGYLNLEEFFNLMKNLKKQGLHLT